MTTPWVAAAWGPAAWEEGVRDAARVAALERSGLVGSGPEDAFDRLVEVATEVVGVSRGVISLVDAVWTTAKSAVGFPEGSPRFAPIEQFFCRFVVGSGRPLVIDDARRDPRTRDDPAIAAFDAATWAGYPIRDADGAVLGTFCLMDSSPHEWTARDLHVLAALAQAASTEIALRRAQAEARAARQAADALRSARPGAVADLLAQLHELIAEGGANANVGRQLRAWLLTRTVA